jgi:para-aminobenzoate synthetase/4-amino-4-deoxychorismate lyase
MRPDPAYGVFDTLVVRAGRPIDLEAHVARVARSVGEVYAAAVDGDALAARITAEAEGLGTARVRTTYDPVAAGWRVEATRIEEPALEPRTLEPRRVRGGLGAHKWCDRRLVAAPDAADDVLLVDEDDVVLECGSANVFAALPGEGVVTPPLDGRILPGTVRARVLEQIAVLERPLRLAELPDATELFVTSSVRGVQPVIACLGVGAWPIGQVATALATPQASPGKDAGNH